MHQRISVTILSLFFLFFLQLSVCGAVESNKIRVAVFPFITSHGGEYAQYGEILHTMLSSRLSREDGLEIVEVSATQKQFAGLQKKVAQGGSISVFRQLKADYIVKSELFEIQNELKVQATFFQKGGQESPLILTAISRSDDEIIDNINDLAEKAVIDVFQLRKEDAAFSSSQTIAGFRTAHPEKAYRKGVYAGRLFGDEDGGMEVANNKRASLKLDGNIVSMQFGDLDGDGEQELVAATRTTAWVLHVAAKQFKILAEIPLGSTYKLNGLNLADLNSDGRDEIYISGSRKFDAASKVLTWDKSSGVVNVHNEVRWYLRPVKERDGSWMLLGQRATKDENKGYVSDRVQVLREVTVQKREKVLGVELKQSPFEVERISDLPAGVNIFDFVYADLDGDNLREVVAISGSEKLMVYNQSNSLLYVSDGNFGGSVNYFGHTPASVAANTGMVTEVNDDKEVNRIKQFIPTRLIAEDVNGDGKDDIIVGRNRSSEGFGWLTNTRVYNGGLVSCLSWDGKVMNELWRTKNIGGYLPDYQFRYTGNTRKDGEEQTYHEAVLVTASYQNRDIFSFLLNDETLLSAIFLEINKEKMGQKKKENPDK